MEERIEYNAINVGTLGTFVIGTLSNANPALRFVVREAGVMKGIGTWTTAPILAIGANIAGNNLMPNSNLTNIALRGRNETEPVINGLPSGQDIRLRVNTAGAVSVGTPVVDVYLIGSWEDITTT